MNVRKPYQRRMGKMGRQGLKVWRKPEGVEPSLPAKREATGFEDREGHRAPLASSIAIWSERANGMVQAGLGGAGRPDVCVS